MENSNEDQVAMRKLIAAQGACLRDIEQTMKRLKERDPASLPPAVLRSRLEALDRKAQDAYDTDKAIAGYPDSENDPYRTEDFYGKLTATYEEAQELIYGLLPGPETNTAVAASDSGISTMRPQSSHTVEVPKVSLPTFSGKEEDWVSFRNSFQSLMTKIPNVPDSTRLQYLISSLQGTAAEIAADVEITDENYALIWETLVEQYDNPWATMGRLVRAIVSMPAVKQESASRLRTFLNNYRRITRTLTSIGVQLEKWDLFLVHHLVSLLPPATRELWSATVGAKNRNPPDDCSRCGYPTGRSMPVMTMDDLETFLKAHIVNIAERPSPPATPTSAPKGNTPKKSPRGGSPRKARWPTKRQPNARRALYAGRADVCPLCKGKHPLWKCRDFQKKPIRERRAEIMKLQRCFNCFGEHLVKSCRGNTRCKRCSGLHHTQLHDDAKHNGAPADQKPTENTANGKEDAKPASGEAVVKANTAQVSAVTARAPRAVTVLATARVDVVNDKGGSTRLRALLDLGAETSFISESAVQLLGLPRERSGVRLSGVGDCVAGTARFSTRFMLRSVVHPEHGLRVDALVLPRVTGMIPTRDTVPLDIAELRGVELADPTFYASERVDLILGADVCASVMRPDLLRLPGTRLVAQDTDLGWIVFGGSESAASRRAGTAAHTTTTALHCAIEGNLTQTLQRFWEVEEVPGVQAVLKPEDQECEEQFRAKHRRDDNGRFVVALPLKHALPLVGEETRAMALTSLRQLHRRFERDPTLADAYQSFMRDYESLGHMERVPPTEIHRPRAWYLPHHPVFSSSTAGGKIRVVFDASRRTREGHSLNNFLKAGPALQRDLGLILLNWRRFKYAFTADIVKMFRQIRVEENDRDVQRIVWAPTASDTPVDYRLTTVTYGTSCAPFLAIRTLLQIAEDGRTRFPLAAECLERCTYVDDIFDGADELALAQEKIRQLVALLKEAGINLDKWAVSHPPLLLTSVHESDATKPIDRGVVKTLGVHWSAEPDEFTFNGLDVDEIKHASTRREILSGVSRLFDPQGWITPVSIIGKVLMQDVSILRKDWDSPVPDELKERWADYCLMLKHLPVISIARWLGTTESQSLQLHGFGDASQRAYAACVYLRISTGEGRVRTVLLASKTKVAPVKTKSIPNLELCGAALLVQLTSHLRKVDWLKSVPIKLWSDSRVVLAWLDKHPCLWKTFVANRVSYIQTELPTATWNHVPTKENPADLATRGAVPQELCRSPLWWHGPEFLQHSPEHWPKSEPTGLVTSQVTLHSTCSEDDIGARLLNRISSYQKLIRVISYCLRPLRRVRQKQANLAPLPAYVTSEELAHSRQIAFRLAQQLDYADELRLLRKGGTLKSSHAMGKLLPFIDTDGLLRVGGRLSRADLAFSEKHPPILSGKSRLSHLIIKFAHASALHGGYTLTTSHAMKLAWIMGARRPTKTIIRTCVTCQRVRPRLASQLMGDLPAARITPARPFSTSGVDYAGPIPVRATKGRGHRAYKGYIALFICFATKAIHLELVSDLTTEAFIAAFRRFTSRRGTCSKLVSDNATNFKGADKELRMLFRAASRFHHEISSLLANDGTKWVFIPPSTPHYGGLWEAGVKSVKHHLRRVIGQHTLTFEELSTILAEIEACLNSRPLAPLSADRDDLNALTPAHFLLGVPSATVPDVPLAHSSENRLNRFQIMQRVRDQVWRRWSTEYVQHLQERAKWRGPKDNLPVGQLVLVQDDRYPPCKWPLGRIEKIHADEKDVVRLVTIKTATGILQRHVAKVAPLHLPSSSTCQRDSRGDK